MLGTDKRAADLDLANAAAATLKSYSVLAPAQRMRSALLNDVNRCLNDDWAPHGEILNP